MKNIRAVIIVLALAVNRRLLSQCGRHRMSHGKNQDPGWDRKIPYGISIDTDSVDYTADCFCRTGD